MGKLVCSYPLVDGLACFQTLFILALEIVSTSA